MDVMDVLGTHFCQGCVPRCRLQVGLEPTAFYEHVLAVLYGQVM